MTTAYASDTLDRVTNITYKTAGGDVIHAFDYCYDLSSLITQKVTALPDGSCITNAYAYDGLGHLVSESLTQSGTNAVTQFTYDLVGNRLTKSVTGASPVISSYTHNRLTTVSDGTTLSYDAAGCVTSIVSVSSVRELVWNSQRQLVSVATNGVFAESYAYDPFGRRVSTTRLATDHQSLATEYHVYDGDECIADLDADGNPLRSYTWGPGIDNLLAMTVFSPDSTNTFYAIKDHLGSVHALVDSQGIAVESYTYEAWGVVQRAVASGQSAVGNRYLFQGREYSYVTGLYNFRARWYDPQTGRWLSNDPIGISGGLNLYAFCGNDPVNYVDPWGNRGAGSKATRYGGRQKPGILTTPATGVRTAGVSAFGNAIDGLNYLTDGTLSLGESIAYSFGFYPVELAKMRQYYLSEASKCEQYNRQLRTEYWYEIQYVLFKMSQEGKSGWVTLVIDPASHTVTPYTGPWFSAPSANPPVITREWVR